MQSPPLNFNFASGSREIAEARAFHDAMPPEGHMFGCRAGGCESWDTSQRCDPIYLARRNGRLVAVLQIEGDNFKLVDDCCTGCLAVEPGPERDAIVRQLILRLIDHLEGIGHYRQCVVTVQLGRNEVAFLESLGFAHAGDYDGNLCFMEKKLNPTPRGRVTEVRDNVHYLDF